MAASSKFGSAALQHAYDRFVGDNADQRSVYERALFDTEVASMIYDPATRRD